MFGKTAIHVGDGKTFVIEAMTVSAQNNYIQSASSNDEPWDRPWIRHAESGDRLQRRDWNAAL